jgi:excisionase family DNA binding protein
MKTSDVSIKELAAYLGVSTDTIRRAYRDGTIPGSRVGTALRFNLRQVLIQMRREVNYPDGAVLEAQPELVARQVFD